MYVAVSPIRTLSFSIFFLLFFYCSNALAIDSSATNPSKLQVSMQPYTVPANLPANIQTFVQNQNNLCAMDGSETRPQCFLQYSAQLNSDGVTYSLITNSLQCPQYYYGVNFLGDAIYNKSTPGAPLYYYGQVSQENLTLAQYNSWVAAGATCTPDLTHFSGSNDVITGGTNLGCCVSSLPPQITDSNGFIGIPVTTMDNNWEQETTECGYAEQCQHYSAPGCPNWCAHGYHTTRYYYMAQCVRPAGFYPSPAAPSADDLASKSTLYTPSTIICAKTSVGWQQAPTN